MRVVWLLALVGSAVLIGRALLTPARPTTAPQTVAGATTTPLPPAGIVGHLAPDAQLLDMSGHPVRLSSYRGQVVVLNFWYAACEPCRYEMPIFERVAHADRGQPVVIIGVDVADDEGTTAGFTRVLGIDYPVLRDTTQQAVLNYNVTVFPTTFVIDRQGVIRARHPGAITDTQTLNQAISPLLSAR